MENNNPAGIGHNVVDIPIELSFAATFFKDGHNYGSSLTREWCFKAVGMGEVPHPKTPGDELTAINLRFLNIMNAVADHMLKEHKMALDSDYHGGYKVLIPAQQAKAAVNRLLRKRRKENKRARMRMTHINHAMLTTEQSKETADLQAKVATEKMMTKKFIWGKVPKIRRPRPDASQE